MSEEQLESQPIEAPPAEVERPPVRRSPSKMKREIRFGLAMIACLLSVLGAAMYYRIYKDSQLTAKVKTERQQAIEHVGTQQHGPREVQWPEETQAPTPGATRGGLVQWEAPETEPQANVIHSEVAPPSDSANTFSFPAEEPEGALPNEAAVESGPTALSAHETSHDMTTPASEGAQFKPQSPAFSSSGPADTSAPLDPSQLELSWEAEEPGAQPVDSGSPFPVANSPANTPPTQEPALFTETAPSQPDSLSVDSHEPKLAAPQAVAPTDNPFPMATQKASGRLSAAGAPAIASQPGSAATLQPNTSASQNATVPSPFGAPVRSQPLDQRTSPPAVPTENSQPAGGEYQPSGTGVFDQHTNSYTVGPNENYWAISKKLYGSGVYFKALFEHNRQNFPFANKLRVGDVISAPPARVLEQTYPQLCPKPATPLGSNSSFRPAGYREQPLGARTYVVEEGDTLYDIARYELGKASRWAEIHELNRQTLGDDYDRLKPGTQILLPAATVREDRLTENPSAIYSR